MDSELLKRRSKFPGTEGNAVDRVLRLANFVEQLPSPFFALLLFLIALVSTRANPRRALRLWPFLLGDWAMLAGLPRAGKSFGPAKPPTLMLTAMRLPAALLPLPWSFLLQIAGSVLVLYGFWVEPHRLTVTRQTLQSAKLKPAPPLRVLHLGDLHVERETARERELLAHLRELAPDLILFSGDFLNLSYLDDPVAWEHAHRILSELLAPLGVYAVSGSPAVDKMETIPHLLDGLEIRWLRNEKVTLEHHGQKVDLVGIHCTHNPAIDGPRLQATLGEDPENLTILLYHSPDLAPQAAAMGIDLQLSGHTHGGQVRLPFYGALYAGSLYGKRFEVGRRQIGPLTLYVTRGIGMEGKGAPRVRFLCPPEIILWEITGESDLPAQ